MDVQLYIYDLSRGMARAFSQQFLGIHLEAIYHTSIVLAQRTEYFFGAGIQSCYPGTTHHGQPMQKLDLGRTELPMEVIQEWLTNVAEDYSHQNYDLFLKNCNNFSNDFAEFLVGNGIPEYIVEMPAQVLNTPIGQMLRPQIDSAMREVTQAPVVSQGGSGQGQGQGEAGRRR